MELKPGCLVLLTIAYEEYRYKKNPDITTTFVNRLAKLEEILDWDSDKGKAIKKARLDSGKWSNLPLEDNKYIFSIYYPDMVSKKGKQGVIERGVPMFSKDPDTGAPFFQPMPEWLYKEILKQCEQFTVTIK